MKRLIEIIKKHLPKDAKVEDLEAELKDAFEEELEDANTGLVAKRDELLREVKRLKDRIKAGDGEDRSKLEDQLDELKAAVEKKDSEIQKLQKTAEKQIKDLTDRLSSETTALDNLVRNEGLIKELAGAGVKKELLPAVHALLRERVRVVADGTERRAVATTKDKDGREVELTLPEYIKTWSQSDEGKHYVQAPANSGSGAGGSTGGSGGAPKTMPRAQFQNLDQQSQFAYVRDGGKVTE